MYQLPVFRRIISCLFFFCTLLVSKSLIAQNCNNWLLTNALDSKVQIGDVDITGDQITVEGMFNLDGNPVFGVPNGGKLVSKHTTTTDINYALLPNGCEITTTNNGYQLILVCYPQRNKWYHAAMTYDGKTMKYYRDGYLMKQVACTGNLINNDLSTTIAQIAGTDNSLQNQFAGHANEIRIWNVAKTQAEIQQYMNTSLPNPATQPGLVAYYTFDDLNNKQGNPAFNAVLMNGATINQTNPDCTFSLDSCFVPIPEKIINSYTEVTGYEACSNRVIVSNSATFHVGDTVLLMQMSGAIANTDNTVAFGDVTDYRNVGNYEFNYVKAVNGNGIDLLNQLTRNYDIADGKVQLIRVPYYQNFSTVNKLTCLPWDGSKGGVLVFNVANTLTLYEDIDVSGRGFKGGIGKNTGLLATNCFTNDYSYPDQSNVAAAKGQSIAILPPAFASGKGKSASGGGGGLDNNSGGGGGGNGGAGGFGGYQLESCGNSPFDNRGIGGIAFPYSNVSNRVFMGGGGGAGHANNPANINQPPHGANGGGIVIINAQTLQSNGHRILSNGNDAPGCTGECLDGMGAGGAGGTILLNIPSVTDNTVVQVHGGNGANVSGDVLTGGRVGAGGGGGGGVFWSSGAGLPANITLDMSGGLRGTLVRDANNPWGTTPGQTGIRIDGLQLPVDNILFRPNIDSVRIRKTDVSCTAFDFNGLGYTNTSPIADWHWYFGDGSTAVTQNTSHNYVAGDYIVKLVITDINGCKDSIGMNVHVVSVDKDFTYSQNSCDPLSVQFSNAGVSVANPFWDFGDGNTITGALTPVHTYSVDGDYLVRFATSEGSCTDTISKAISIKILKENIVLTTDTTICIGTTKLLRATPSLGFCWTPSTYLDNPNLAQPTTSATENITYYLIAQVPGNNLIVNGDFSQGNSGFTSSYIFTASNSDEGQYNIGTNPQAWHSGMNPCRDHTSAAGNMMLVNGSPDIDALIWKQTVTVTPNTNYAFSTWIESLSPANAASLQFSINGKPAGSPITATSLPCSWTQFYTTWNSGNNTSAVISIVNKNTIRTGNDFALDDISFAPVFVKKDSVKITVEKPLVKTIDDLTVCKGGLVTLTTTGAQTYVWDPAATLSDAGIANPVASPVTSTEYHVAGTTVNGCIAKDTITVNVYPNPVISKSRDTTICKNTSVQLFINGASSYSWVPAATLNNPTSPTPVASPVVSPTKYYINITDVNTCKSLDSIQVSIHPDPVFSVNGAVQVCYHDSIVLSASGGDIYAWQPSLGLSNAGISNPKASPVNTTDYSVTITEATCNNSIVLSAHVAVLPLPDVQAQKSNDMDCSVDNSRLSAIGASKYVWTPGETLSNANISNPVAHPRLTTEYVVAGTDASGCTNYDTLTVYFEKINEGAYLMPDAFTPNGDGKNDCFGISYWGIIEEVEFSIYNRWGQQVFYTKDPRGCWDGTIKGILQASDVYVYMIKAKTACEPALFRKGTVVLIR